MPTSNNQPIVMPNLGQMFNLDCFHFNEIKGTIEQIFKYLMDMDSRMDMFEVK